MKIINIILSALILIATASESINTSTDVIFAPITKISTLTTEPKTVSTAIEESINTSTDYTSIIRPIAIITKSITTEPPNTSIASTAIESTQIVTITTNEPLTTIAPTILTEITNSYTTMNTIMSDNNESTEALTTVAPMILTDTTTNSTVNTKTINNTTSDNKLSYELSYLKFTTINYKSTENRTEYTMDTESYRSLMYLILFIFPIFLLLVLALRELSRLIIFNHHNEIQNTQEAVPLENFYS